LNLTLYTPAELVRSVGKRAAALRLAGGRRQVDLAAAAGISPSTLKRFEAGETVAFEVVVRVALALGDESGIAALFSEPDRRSFEDILRSQDAPRRRARRRA
jgi:transcriptional regulator with XRE-family HTH domain